MKRDDIQWLDDPCGQLRLHPDGTHFLMRTKGGVMYVCFLSGNIPEDQAWKFLRHPDLKTLTVEKQLASGSSFALIRQ